VTRPSPAAEVVLPALRWDAERGFGHLAADIERALALGVGGFILFGGEREAVRSLTDQLRAASRTPLLIASDLERGAGQQVRGLTGLPPLMGLAALGEDAVREAAKVTALEARGVGINWVLAPVADLDIEPDNPIVQTRAFGADPAVVGRLAVAWIGACQKEGVLACVKHFPGHGRTTRDSHAELPVVDVFPTVFATTDMVPFRAAIDAGVAAVMTAHVAYPELAGDQPATYSATLLSGLLRSEFGHSGLVVTDALIMDGALAGRTPGDSAVRALGAGCDLLLYPKDLDGVVAAVDAAAERDAAFAGRIEQSRARRDAAARLAKPPRPLDAEAMRRHEARGADLARESVRLLRGMMPRVRGAVSVTVVDDDAGGPYTLPPRSVFAGELSSLGVEVRPSGGERIVLLFADVKSWKGRAGLSPESARHLEAALAEPAVVVVFGHPRRLADVPGDHPVLCAWSGDETMQRAAARRLTEAT